MVILSFLAEKQLILYNIMSFEHLELYEILVDIRWIKLVLKCDQVCDNGGSVFSVI